MNMWGLLCVAVCLSVHHAGAAAAKTASLPKEFKTCPRGDDGCLKEAISAAFPYLVRGLPKLGVLPVDPLRVTEVIIDQGSGPVNIKLHFINQDILGLKDVIITKVQSDLQDETYTLGIESHIGTMDLVGDYRIDGKILVLPIRGEGKNNLSLSDVNTRTVMNGHVREGFVHLENFIVSFDISKMHLDFENLFNGDKTLGDNMNAFLNENWKVVLAELKPAIQEAFSAVFKEIVQRIFSKVPYDDIHPRA